MFSSIVRDLRLSIRRLSKSPGFVLVTVLTLGLGIGANSAIFSMASAVLLKPLPYNHPEQLVLVWGTNALNNRTSISAPNFLDYRDQNRVFQYMATFAGTEFIVADASHPERVEGARVSQDFFKALGVQPAIGRNFLDEEMGAGKNNVVIISYGFWQRHFGGSPTAINQTLTMDGAPYTIIGVLPEEFNFTIPVLFPSRDLWIPAALVRDDSQRGRNNLRVLARMKEGVSLVQAQENMDSISRALAQQFPQDNEGRGTRLISLREQIVGNRRKSLLLLFGAVGFVLLIACSNIANLQLERATGRQKEFAIRAALGASHSSIIRELLTECILLSLIAGIFGVFLAFIGISLLKSLFPGPMMADIRLLDSNVLAFSIIIAMLTGVIFGLAPSLQSSKSILSPIREGTRTINITPSRSRFRDLLVVAEMTLSLALLIGAAFLIQSFVHVLRVPLGFDTKNQITVDCDLPDYIFPDNAKRLAFFQRALDQLQHVPGIQWAAAIDDLPLTPDRDAASFFIEGTNENPNALPDAQIRTVTPHYFKAMGIPLTRGRAFEESDTPTTSPVIIVNQSMTRQFFGGENPVGKRVRVDSRAGSIWAVVVGEVTDVRDLGPEISPEPEIYRPYQQHILPTMALVASTNANPATLMDSVRHSVQSVDSSLPQFNVDLMSKVAQTAISDRLLSTFLLSLFASIALVLAIVGVYSVFAYSVMQRTHEIGIRMAMGAQKIDIFKIILRRGAILCSAGMVLGLITGAILAHLIAGMLFGVSAANPVIYIAASLLLMVTAFLACYFPALRATRVQPIQAVA